MARATPTEALDRELARRLVLDELFDLSLYRSLRGIAPADLRAVLDQLIPIEERHFRFWQKFFGLHVERLDLLRRAKLSLLVATCRLLGAPAIHLVLEAIEVYGVRKYLEVWQRYGDGPLGAAVREVLEDEFRHEDEVVTGDEERRIQPERVRNIFLGMNDGLVEILGAMSGFFGAFGKVSTVLVAAIAVAVAGALSMTASAWAAASSEAEVERTELGRRRFLGEKPAEAHVESPLSGALVVGASYLAGSLIPLLPVLFGAHTLLLPVLTASAVIVLVSIVVSFLSGMRLRRRIVMNLIVIFAAVGVSYAIGLAVKEVFGVVV